MAGYVGTKAVLLSTTAANVGADANIGGALDVGGAFTSQGIDDNATSTAMTLDASGNVGVGASSPFAPLTVKNNPSFGIYSTFGYYSDNYPQLMFASNASTPATAHIVASTLIFNNSTSSEAMRIDASGNLLVGKTGAGLTNDGAMDFVGGQSAYGGALGINHSTVNVSGSGFINFARHTAYIGNIAQNGTTGVSYNTTSDYRLKENVIGLTNATTRLKQLEPKRFNFIADADRTVDGFLAHEVQPVVPEAITGTKDEVDADGNPVYQGIDQSKLVPLLTAALQEALTKIDDLETRVATLEAN